MSLLTHLAHPLRTVRSPSNSTSTSSTREGTASHPIVLQVHAEMTASAALCDETWQDLIRHMNVLGEDDLHAVLRALTPWLATGLPDEQPIIS